MGAALFAAELRHLASRYRLVTASELPEAAVERRPGERFPAAITFDDDTRSHVELVAPLLRSRGATATFYLTGASLEGSSPFWWERLQAAVARGLDVSSLELQSARAGAGIHDIAREIERLDPAARDRIDDALHNIDGTDPPDQGLGAKDVERLVAAGFEIGFHTRRHYRLPELDDDALARALREGRSKLEDVVGGPLRSIAYPHGVADARVAEAAREAGFRTGYTGRDEAITAAQDILLLGRVSPSYRSLGELAFDVAWAIFRSRSSR